MKKLMLVLSISYLMLATACDPCRKTICLNGGECVEAVCNCPNGYEGETCELLTRNNYTGTWYGTGSDGTYSTAVNWSVTSRPNVDELLVDGQMILKFNGSNITLLGITNPEIGYTYSGSGTISKSKLDMQLRISDGSETYVFTYDMAK